MSTPERAAPDQVHDDAALTKRLPMGKIAAATIGATAVISAVMLQISWDGVQGSTAAPKIDTLLDVMIVLSSFVFSLVMVMMGYALLKFRAKPGDEGDGEPIHGNTRLEVAWTVIPTVIVLFGAGFSWATLHSRFQAVGQWRMTTAAEWKSSVSGTGSRAAAGTVMSSAKPPGRLMPIIPVGPS